MKRTTYTRIKTEFYLSREYSFSNSWTVGEININSNWCIVCWRKRGVRARDHILNYVINFHELNYSSSLNGPVMV